VAEAFDDTIDLVLDGGPTAAGKPSTILDLTSAEPRILREGLLPATALQAFLPELNTP
jgi:tRNA A37 threonylcarbamoyladenosine synthetase subunit TsaC/SUA5/YrdC